MSDLSVLELPMARTGTGEISSPVIAAGLVNTTREFLHSFSIISDDSESDFDELDEPDTNIIPFEEEDGQTHQHHSPVDLPDGPTPETPVASQRQSTVAAIPFRSIHNKRHGFSPLRKSCWMEGVPVTVKITDVKREEHPHLSRHAFNPYLYTIEISHGESKWTVRRRYKHFQSLHSALQLYRARYAIPVPTTKHREMRQSVKEERKERRNRKDRKVSRFPKKLEVLVRPDGIEKRKMHLELYLQSVLESKLYRKHNETLKFLEVSELSFINRLGEKWKEGDVKKCSGGRRISIGCCGCLKKYHIAGRWSKRWLVLKDTFVTYLRPSDGCICDVILMDYDFKVEVGLDATGASHGLLVTNLTRNLLVKCWTKRKAEEWEENINKAAATIGKDFTKPNRYDSFAPVRDKSFARWFVDGSSYFEAVADALEKAKEEIFITGWWLTPEIYMKRPMTQGDHWRLDVILTRKAKAGVKVFILLYKEMEIALNINSHYSKRSLVRKCPENIKVLRHPDHGASANGVLLWAHHEKLVVIDQKIAFLGGLDICYGRWDDETHKLVDLGCIIGRGKSPQNSHDIQEDEIVNGGTSQYSAGSQHETNKVPKTEKTGGLPTSLSDHSIRLKLGADKGPPQNFITSAIEDSETSDTDIANNSGGSVHLRDTNREDMDLHTPDIADSSEGSNYLNEYGKGATDNIVKFGSNANLADNDSLKNEESLHFSNILVTVTVHNDINVPKEDESVKEVNDENKRSKSVTKNLKTVNFENNNNKDGSTITSDNDRDHVDHGGHLWKGRPVKWPGRENVNIKSDVYLPNDFSNVTSPEGNQDKLEDSSAKGKGGRTVPDGIIKSESWASRKLRQTFIRQRNVKYEEKMEKAEDLDHSLSNTDEMDPHRAGGLRKKWRMVLDIKKLETAMNKQQAEMPLTKSPAGQKPRASMVPPVSLGAKIRNTMQFHQRKDSDASLYDLYPWKKKNKDNEPVPLNVSKLNSIEQSPDDKLLGSSKLWIGKDYVNFIFKDPVDVHNPFEDLINREKTPRMPWHDIGAVVYGKAARDVARHFIGRWNFTKTEKFKTNMNYPLLLPKSYSKCVVPPLIRSINYECQTQILRSSCGWSAGINRVERSIHTAYIDCIDNAKHFIYIENQFFITQVGDQRGVKNKIAEALLKRIIRAYMNHETFRVYVVLPLLPAFEGNIGEQGAYSIRAVTHWNYVSMSKGPNAIWTQLQKKVDDPDKYICFCGLRTHAELQGRLVTELVYVHSKLMIVDDDTIIIGSANINDRSMLGTRDSELAVLINDTKMFEVRMNGVVHYAGHCASSLRRTLFREHLGLSENESDVDISDPVCDEFYKKVWWERATTNTSLYHRVFRCIPDDNVKTFSGIKSFTNSGALAESDPQMARHELKRVQGRLVLMPLRFLEEEDSIIPVGPNREAMLPSKTWV
ncbi:hypothetical protein CHS0354_025266 [Potamilus streckersoni]|uniref:Phospholipase n=1 Tax=Potamilus streckersoni TaxID=2493646 RepID=A0AAE0RS25_9BIVA|nr:hypothetical protein CHS0354_025266 [Potamilus streckersoni]